MGVAAADVAAHEPFVAGQRVRIRGLAFLRTELNGCCAHVKTFDLQKGLVTVELATGEVLNLKPIKLEVVAFDLLPFVNVICQPVTEKWSWPTKKTKLHELVREAEADGAKDIINQLCYRDDPAGRTPLAYAVALNDSDTTRELVAMGANVDAKMETDTALTIAVKNKKLDCTEMVRLLLSMGADPECLAAAGIDERGDEFREQLNLTMRHWLGVARRVGVQPAHVKAHAAKFPPMDRMHELHYAVVGEEPALTLMKRALTSHYCNPAAQSKPLVIGLLGPPGHGKTYLTRNVAESLVGKENVLEVACGAVRDDADLFGSSLGGCKRGDHSSYGLLTDFLRDRQSRDTIVFLDEFEKIKDLTSSLGWGQAKKIYQAFLEPWQEGTLTDFSARAHGGKISTSKTVWVLTSNWGQEEIIAFSEKHRERVYGHISDSDVAWLKKELVQKILSPLLIKQFGSVHADLKALARRMDVIVPFLPFTDKEQTVVADIELRRRLGDYRRPCVQKPEEKRRMLGNVILRHTRALTRYATAFYDPMQGATTMCTIAREADGLFNNLFLEGKLKCDTAQQMLLTSDKAPAAGAALLPEMWLHFDENLDQVGLWEGAAPPSTPTSSSTRRKANSADTEPSEVEQFATPTVSDAEDDDKLQPDSGPPVEPQPVNPFA